MLGQQTTRGRAKLELLGHGAFRLTSVGWALIGLFLITASTTLQAQESTAVQRSPAPIASEDKVPAQDSEGSLFFDPEDGWLDFSAFLATASGFLPVASVITEPAVGLGGTFGLLFLHDSIADRAALVTRESDGSLRRLPPPSMSWVGGFATENGSWGSGVAHLRILREDRYRYLGGFFYSGMNLDYFGSGGDLGLPIDSLSYTLDGYYLVQKFQGRVADTDLFLGANFKFMSFDAALDLDLDIDPPDWFPPLARNIKSSGIGVFAEYDSRNTIFTPDSGINAKAEVVFYDEALGGDRTFQKGQANLRGWVPLRASWVLGLRADTNVSGGDIPFYLLPAVDLRGISKSRYQGESTVTTEAELRWDFTRRWSLLGFVGSGWASEGGLGDLGEGNVAGGTGFRYLISRVFGMRTGMDFAWSQEDFAFYFTSGTAWGQR